MIENDGMRYPSIDWLLQEMAKTSEDSRGVRTPMSSKYRLVVAIAKRSRDINATGECYVTSPRNHKAIGVALEEVTAGKIAIRDETVPLVTEEETTDAPEA